MHVGQLCGFLVIVLILSPKLAQTLLAALGDGGLADQPAQDQLPGLVDPAARQAVDGGAPEAGLKVVQVRGRRRAALPGGQDRNDIKAGGGFAASSSYNGTPNLGAFKRG